MKTFHNRAAQGEIQIRKVDGLPPGVTPMKAEAGKFIVGHSETGHHHVISAYGADVAVLDKAPDGMRVLYAILNEPNHLTHERGHDTHETIRLEPGVYEFRIGREFDPYAELARRQMD